MCRQAVLAPVNSPSLLFLPSPFSFRSFLFLAAHSRAAASSCRHMFFCATLAIGLVRTGVVQGINMDRETYIKCVALPCLLWTQFVCQKT